MGYLRYAIFSVVIVAVMGGRYGSDGYPSQHPDWIYETDGLNRCPKMFDCVHTDGQCYDTGQRICPLDSFASLIAGANVPRGVLTNPDLAF